MANDKTYDRHVNIWINGKEVKNDISSIKKEMFNLYNQVAKTTRGSDEYNKKVAELKKVKGILKEHQDSVSATGGAWSKVKGLFSSAQGMIVAGIAGIAGAYQSVKSIIFSTDALGDKFEKTLGGWKGGLDAVARAIATMNFKDLGRNIRAAIDEGRRYAESLDNIDEKTRALMIAEAKANNEILRQTEISRSALYSKEEQIAAGKKIIQIEEDLTKIRTGIANQAYINESKNIQNLTHLTEAEIEAYAEGETQMLANIEAGKVYNQMVSDKNSLELKAIAAGQRQTSLTQDQINELDRLQNAIAGASEETKRFAFAAANMAGDEKMLLFTNKIIEREQAIGSGLENTMKTRILTAKNEEQLDKESHKRMQDDIELKELAEKYTEEYFDKEQKRNQKELKDIELMERYTEEYFKNEQKRNQKELEDLMLMDKWTEEYFAKERQRDLENLENQLVIKANNLFAIIDLEKQKNEALRLSEIAAAETTGASVQLINEKYAKLDQDLDKKKLDSKLQIASEFFANVAMIAGKQSAIGKAAAIAETTISTYKSATESYAALAGIPVVGPALGFVAAAAAVAAGLANVRKIVSVKTDTPKYYTGGFTGTGGKHQPAGIVHKGEYVINADTVANPAFRPMIESLEYARVNGNAGYVNGGNVGTGSSGSGAAGPSSISSGSDPELKALIRENLRVNKMLLRDGVKTHFDYIAVDNVRKGMSKLDEIEQRGTM